MSAERNRITGPLARLWPFFACKLGFSEIDPTYLKVLAMKIIKETNYSRLVLHVVRILLAIVAIALVPFNSSSQTTGPLDRQTPLALSPGAPAGSRIEDLASVNLF